MVTSSLKHLGLLGQEAGMIAPCGVNCMACSAHLDKKNPCPGCRAPEVKITRKSCRNCVKKKCAFEQGFEWCFECGRFPCSHIKSLNKRYLKNYNVDLVQNGLDARQDMASFLKAQKKRFTCEICGGIINQHHRHCSECGSSE
ncbi:MAG: DUF3795 domain-containing protein [Eubacteriaceae bacterium]